MKIVSAILGSVATAGRLAFMGAGTAASTVLGITGLSPTILVVALVAIIGSFGAGMVVEARWSEKLILTQAEKAKDEAIATLTAKIDAQRQAAIADANARAQREAELQSENDQLLREAESHASNNVVLPANLVSALNRVGGVRPAAKANHNLRSLFPAH